ncbi:RNA polymerase factor sigma-54 [Thiocystis violascens]|uniref:RNA polymerase sigma-54 factor n=1 Tax=Thiocystis violascens (strain ATCC 17096 / DSM 198 / 6111) TaxID=765911 RepID=I3YB15_THIV6|nr:RNA polymerase factor sigma-54 [Thiocystis violascens]AFL74183.1 RNA polymerase, sigma 54 subunit, RpoN/SigL [Thiocystis violascens DSM 198]
MKQSIQLRLGQHLTMTPQLQQAIKLLQLSTLELQKEIQEALDTNLMLEEGDDAERFSASEASDSRIQPIEEVARTRAEEDLRIDREVPSESSEMPDELPVDTQWEDVYDSYLPTAAQGGDDGADYDPFAHQSRPQTLHDHLAWQLNLSRLNERDFMIAQAIIDAIDADGYLRTHIEDLLTTIDHPEIGADEVQTLLHRVQSLDPPGVGARDPRECLLLQLRQMPSETPCRDLAIAICRDGFEHLPRKDIAALARLLNAPEPEIVSAIELIRRLNPRPGSLIEAAPSEYVVPDLFVRKLEGRWLVELNPESTPKLRVNADYARLIRRSDQSADGTTLKSHLQEARWFIKSLASRNDTVLRVGSKIVEMQQDFFEQGDEGMRPMILRDIAEALELHESTVSRVTTQKYMHTPRGTFEFKYFFSSHVNTASGGECSSTAIRALIRKLIAAESARKPLSDEKIAKELEGQGIKVARRTVAKYREAMGLPPSNERKRLD